MVKCKKYNLDVTRCSHWTGSLPTEECEICVLRLSISGPHGFPKGWGKTIRRNMYRPIRNKTNMVKRIPILRVHPFFKGGSING